MTRNGLQSLSWRPAELRLIQGSLRRSYALGQASGAPLVVQVVDVGGKPIQTAVVDVMGGGQAQTAVSDVHGRASFSVPAGSYDVRATYKDLVVVKSMTSEELSKGATAFIQFPLCVVDPLIRPIDLVIFGVAGGMVAAGNYWKIKPLGTVGEIALGAAIFGFIYRLQCM